MLTKTAITQQQYPYRLGNYYNNNTTTIPNNNTHTGLLTNIGMLTNTAITQQYHPLRLTD